MRHSIPQVSSLLALTALLLGCADAFGQEKPADPINPRDRQFWSFRPLQALAVPAVKGSRRGRTPIDAFLLAKLEDKGLRFAPDADRAMLLRRVYLDLLGLLPAPEEADAFLHDKRADALEQLVERLLASPHFGERWGRHWLDAAGYADVRGTDNDAGIVRLAEGSWRYRDYVVRAFNQDMPFRRFVLEQLAGDELVDWRSARSYPPETLELLVATGFLRTAADDTEENELNTLDIRHGVQQRTLEVVASNLLGLTLNCARCHDHRYEPILQEDYYRLAAIFSPAFNPNRWLQPKQRQLPDVPPAEKAAIDKRNAEIDQHVAGNRQRQAEIRRVPEAKLLEARLTVVDTTDREALRQAVQTVPEKRTAAQQALADRWAARLITPAEVTAALGPQERAELTKLERALQELMGQRRKAGVIQAVYDAGPPTPTHLLRRGEHHRPGREVAPGFLAVLSPPGQTALPAATPQGSTSGRRLALARVLTQPNSPALALLARVQVNRVWQRLFGKGLAATTDNLGRSGAAPTHPELLDWLAAEFLRHEGRFKPLLKLLLTSTAYRQSSVAVPVAGVDPMKVDPGNRLLWRMPLRRLESEIIRDSILAVSGQLDRTPGGPPVLLQARPDGMVVVKDKGPGQWRRSLYLLARRNYHHSFLNAFDQPVMTSNCICRTPSAVVLQSLTMLNDSLVLEQADQFARRVEKLRGLEQPQRLVETAYQLALTRRPEPTELAACVDFLQRQEQRYRKGTTPEEARRRALAQLCHVLLNTSEFLYTP